MKGRAIPEGSESVNEIRRSAEEPFRCGTATLAGRSNVGKSTLLNRLIGVKLAITSNKPQTTRGSLLGIENLPGAQVLWLDTPGLHAARSLLNRKMVESAVRSLEDAHVAVAVVDAAAGFTASDRHALAQVAEAGRPWLIAVNKIDLVGGSALIAVLAALSEAFPGIDCVPVSARTGRNLRRLESLVAERLPEAPPAYPVEELTDQTSRQIVAEFVREQIFAATKGEVPYRTAVVIEAFEEKPRVNVVHAAILVERESQKRILVGSGGRQIRDIGTRARAELERFFERRFHLELFVKVEEGWTERKRLLEEMGI